MATNIKNLMESHLKVTLQGGFSALVNLISPDAEKDQSEGQVVLNTIKVNPDSGEAIVVNNPVVSLRTSTLLRVPVAGENWVFNIPISIAPDSPTEDFMLLPGRAPEIVGSIGFIRYYLKKVKQSA